MKRTFSLLLMGGCALAGGALGTVLVQNPGTIYAESSQVPPPPPPAASPYQSHVNAPSLGERFEQVIQKVSPAVVAIEAIKPPANTGNGRSGKPIEESGSGVILKLEGVSSPIVITNNHVISKARSEDITVHLADNRLYHPVQVWTDPESDVAVLRLEVENLPIATTGDSERARVGQWVLAFGSPFGLNQTVTHGIISARERGQVSLGSTIRIKDFLQTDAAINPGSSGGPLVNLEGEVVGINTAIASHSGSNSGVAFSIPINMVKRVARQLIEKGSVSRGYLGVHLTQTMEPGDALKLGLDRVQGALIESIYPDSPAALAGLRANDVILQVDGQPIRNENHLINLISSMPAEQKVRMQVWRERKLIAIDALVGDWSKAQARLRAQ